MAELPMPPPAALLHLPTATREQIRTVQGLRIPCEKRIIQCKLGLSDTHGCRTGAFSGGAYLTDPLRFVQTVAGGSRLLVVGGDTGGGHTKLGITYTVHTDNERSQTFAALLVYDGKDSWEELSRLQAEGLTPFEGDTERFPHIFAVLQHLIDEKKALLNGDWLFVNTILGLKSASAKHPCPICIVSSGRLLATAPYRTCSSRHSLHPEQPPLLIVPPECIVPTPLHVFLGISNRIVLDAFSELFGPAVVQQTISQVKTRHSAGCSGLSDMHDLNGQEIGKWLKRECSAKLLEAAAASSAAVKASHSLLTRWLQQLHDCLLHKLMWDAEDIDSWRSIVSDVHRHWQVEAGSAPFPKLHMLHHTVEFAERYRFLGRASEAQIESFHAKFNALFHKQHHNKANDTAERLRRSLADSALKAVQSQALENTQNQPPSPI
jgi:hypothetical protein